MRSADGFFKKRGDVAAIFDVSLAFLVVSRRVSVDSRGTLEKVTRVPFFPVRPVSRTPVETPRRQVGHTFLRVGPKRSHSRTETAGGAALEGSNWRFHPLIRGTFRERPRAAGCVSRDRAPSSVVISVNEATRAPLPVVKGHVTWLNRSPVHMLQISYGLDQNRWPWGLHTGGSGSLKNRVLTHLHISGATGTCGVLMF